MNQNNITHFVLMNDVSDYSDAFGIKKTYDFVKAT